MRRQPQGELGLTLHEAGCDRLVEVRLMAPFAKIVLSRKGYDSSSGGSFSPYDPSSLRYMVLPIPESDEDAEVGNALRFEDVKIREGYLPYTASNLGELIEVSGRKQMLCRRREGRDTWIDCRHAHLDPWLGPCPWLDGDSNHHVGAFGQVGTSQAHLRNQGVGEGSLFLFFSRFVPIEGRANSLGIEVNNKKGAYFLYGWLRVGKVIERLEDISSEEIRARHPHATRDYFAKPNNTVYVASRLLFADDCTPGCGYFPTLDARLLLSSERHLHRPTVWRLPEFFYETRPTVLRRRAWSSDEGGYCLVEVPRRWQEAVFPGSEGFDVWFRDLVNTLGQKGP